MGISRRAFLDGIGKAGGAAAAYHAMMALGLFAGTTPGCAAPPLLATHTGKGVRVAILGGGIAGLVSAFELSKAGFSVTVLESRDRPGGRVFTVRRRYLQSKAAFGGQPQRNRQVNADARGLVAELAAKAIGDFGRALSLEDKERLRAFLKDFGAFDKDFSYRGSEHAGHQRPPGGGPDEGMKLEPLDIQQLFRADFWRRLYPIWENSELATTMLRPVGGMSKIPEAIARSLGPIVKYNAEVIRLRRQGEGARVEWRDTRTGGASAVDADYVVVTMQPGLLLRLDQDFSPRVRQALAAPVGTPFAKLAFQANRRFWELDEQIYGGISWTDHPITQIWYPSQGIHSPKGILVGAYLFTGGDVFAERSVAERIELGREGGELLHPDYRKYVDKGVSIASVEEASAHAYTAEERRRMEANRARHFVGSPATVQRQIGALAARAGVDELMALTITHDHRARRRSYELMREAFAAD
jgi:monoamine oxidase